MPTTFYTQKEVNEIRNNLDIYRRFYRTISHGISEKIKKKYGRKYEKNGKFPFIPLDDAGDLPEIFKKVKKIVGKPGSMTKFLDAGSGPGFICYLATSVGYDSTGIEINRDVINLFKTMFPVSNRYHLRIKKANILTFKEYSKYDVIYYYSPLSKDEPEIKFEEKVEDDMKVGAILIFYRKMSMKLFKDKRFRKIEIKRDHYPDSWTVYQKIRN